MPKKFQWDIFWKLFRKEHIMVTAFLNEKPIFYDSEKKHWYYTDSGLPIAEPKKEDTSK